MVKFSHIVIIRDVGVLSCGFGYMRHISNLLGSLEGVVVAGDVRHDGTFIRFRSVDQICHRIFIRNGIQKPAKGTYNSKREDPS